MLGPAHLLYLATAAGAKAIGLQELAGDLTPGKQADLVLVKAPRHGTLEAVLEDAPDWNAALGAIFTLAREEAILETRVAGEIVWSRAREA
jgi:guanine deaminase